MWVPNLFRSSKQHGKNPADKETEICRVLLQRCIKALWYQALAGWLHFCAEGMTTTGTAQAHSWMPTTNGIGLVTHTNCRNNKSINQAITLLPTQKLKKNPKRTKADLKILQVSYKIFWATPTYQSLFCAEGKGEFQRHSLLSAAIATPSVIVSYIKQTKNITFLTCWSLSIFFTGILLGLSTPMS